MEGTLLIVQGSPEWRAARAGSLGASQIADATARVKNGWGASRANVMAQLLTERLTGIPTETFTNATMQRGNEKEPDARRAYELATEAWVDEVGLVRHPTIAGTHASPDGLVGTDGGLEIKCPASATHIDTLLGGTIPEKYIKQMQWQMACTGRKWVDFVSFDDRLPERMQLFVKRLHRDDKLIRELEEQVSEFLAELEQKLAALSKSYGEAA
jgi:putative phage-type endonuclease